MSRLRSGVIWAVLALLLIGPVGVAARSELLQWRDGTYIVAGLSGIIGLALMLLQALLATARVPGIGPGLSRRAHLWLGLGLLAAIVIHVGGLWLTSPPDVIDALLFNSPTPFSLWGVIAMWAAFAAAVVALLRRRLGLRAHRTLHSALVVVVVGGTILHALLIDGTMGTASKVALCLAVAGVTAKTLRDRRAWRLLRRRAR